MSRSSTAGPPNRSIFRTPCSRRSHEHLRTFHPAADRQPLGYTIVGGLLLSQLLTLYTTPVVYLYLDRLGNWLKRARRPAPVAENAA
jgi:hypothetical protein